MWRLEETDINVGGLLIARPEAPKTGEPKIIPMLDEDIELCRELPKGLRTTSSSAGRKT